MFVFAHTGISLLVYHGIAPLGGIRSPLRDPIRSLFIAFFALLPDILDKPLTVWVLQRPVSTRWIAHSLLFSLIVCLLVYRFLPALRPWVWACPGHLILDSMWDFPHTLLFPFLGFRWDPGLESPYSLWQLLLGNLNRLLLNPGDSIPELVGLTVLLFPFVRGLAKLFTSKAS